MALIEERRWAKNALATDQQWKHKRGIRRRVCETEKSKKVKTKTKEVKRSNGSIQYVVDDSLSYLNAQFQQNNSISAVFSCSRPFRNPGFRFHAEMQQKYGSMKGETGEAKPQQTFSYPILTALPTTNW